MKYVVILFFMMFTQLTFGQEERVFEKTLQEQLRENMRDLIKKLDKNMRVQQNKKLQEVGFLDIQNIEVDFVLRYCTYDSVIEVIRKGDALTGMISFFIKGVKENNEKEIYIITETLSIKDCELIMDHITSIDLKLDSEEDIEGWKQNHYYAFKSTIEVKENEELVFKVYRTSSTQIDVEEDVLGGFVKSVENLSQYKKIKKRFYKENPYKSYLYWNGYGVHISH